MELKKKKWTNNEFNLPDHLVEFFHHLKYHYALMCNIL